jgi:hypothetical protein
MTKQSFAVWSTDPAPRGFRFEDVTEAVRAEWAPCAVVGDYTGSGRVLGCTVLFQGDQAQRGVAVVELPDGAHSVVYSEDPACMQAMQEEEFCGRTLTVRDNTFALEDVQAG